MSCRGNCQGEGGEHGAIKAGSDGVVNEVYGCRREDDVSVGLLTLVAAIYVWVAVGYYHAGFYGMGIAFIAYAFANVGFAIDIWMKS